METWFWHGLKEGHGSVWLLFPHRVSTSELWSQEAGRVWKEGEALPHQGDA